jgi:hypothetical protein
MGSPKTYYDLQASQVSTPPPIVSFYWQVLRRHRKKLGRVLDLGAGDARFARYGAFEQYVGVEIDRDVAQRAELPKKGQLRLGCAFAMQESDFDACIGNPPYVRHHHLEAPWKQETVDRLSRDLGIKVDAHANLFVHFLCLSVLKTHANGLIALVVPFEWVSKPSARAIREYVQTQGWAVTVYRFRQPIFDRVITTASISVIDKKERSGTWRYFDISKDLKVQAREGATGGGRALLPYRVRSCAVYARRGMSPGSQRVFTLTEGERRHHGLSLRDVQPCVTSLRWIPRTLRTLTSVAFHKYFVQAGHRCWLIRSRRKHLGDCLRAYLDGVPESARSTYTCENRDPWYQYEFVSVPRLLFHSGFTSFGPKVVVNALGAVNVGSVFGIHAPKKASIYRLQTHLTGYDFECRLVAHARKLKKIEVGQVNAVLEKWWQRQA